MMKLPAKRTGGFTLIELMIVVAIIGILAAIAIPNFLRFQLRSRSTEGRINIAAIRTAEESYKAEFNSYVAAALSPAANPVGNAKVTFTDVGGAGSNFDTMGWRPEGSVYFNYEVVTDCSGECYFVGGLADIDNDGVIQAWGYHHPQFVIDVNGNITATNDVAVALTNGCAPADLTDNVTGSCDPQFGQSIF